MSMETMLHPKARRVLYPNKKQSMIPIAHCLALRGFASARLPLAGAEAIQSAPAKIPMLVIEVTSINTVLAKASWRTGWLQKAFTLGSKAPVAWAILAAHKPKPYTIPHGVPAIIDRKSVV